MATDVRYSAGIDFGNADSDLDRLLNRVDELADRVSNVGNLDIDTAQAVSDIDRVAGTAERLGRSVSDSHEIDVDGGDAETEIQKILRRLDDLDREIQDKKEIEISTEKARKNLEDLADIAKAAFTAEALGGAGSLLSGLDEAGQESEAALRQLKAITGATGEDFEALKDRADDLFLRGLGDNVAEARQALGLAQQQLGQFLDPAELDEFILTAGGIAKTFDKDISEVLGKSRTFIAQFGLSGKEAGDLVSVTMQKAGTAMDDVLDTMDEYSQLAVKAGFDAKEFSDLLITGVQAGTRDTDKLADALKETSIRLNQGDASNALKGIDSAITGTIQGIVEAGEQGTLSVKEVLQASSNEIERAFNAGEITESTRQQLQSALAGTPAEDIGSDIFAKVFSAPVPEAAIQKTATEAGGKFGNLTAAGIKSGLENIDMDAAIKHSAEGSNLSPAGQALADKLSGEMASGLSLEDAVNDIDTSGLFQEAEIRVKTGDALKALDDVDSAVSDKISSIVEAGKQGELSISDVLKKSSEEIESAFSSGEISESVRSQLQEALGGTSAEDLGADKFADAFGAASADGIKEALKNGDLPGTLTEEADLAGSQMREALGRINFFIGLNKQFDLLQTKASELFGPAIAGAGDVLTRVSQVAPAIDLVSKRIDDAGGLGAVFDNVKGRVSGLGAQLKNLGPLVSKLGTGLKSLATGPALGIAAVAGALVLAYNSSEDFRAAVDRLVSTLGDSFGKILDSLEPVLTLLTDKLATALEGIVEAVGPVLDKLAGVLGDLLVTVVDALTPLLTTITDILSGVLGKVLDTITPILTLLADTIAGFIGPLIDTLTPVIESLLSVIGPVLDALASTLAPVLETITTVLGVLLEALAPVIDVMGDLLKIILPILVKLNIWVNLIKLAAAVLEVLAPIIADVATGVADLIKWITGAQDATESSSTTFGVLHDVIETVGDIIGYVVDRISELINWISETITWLADGIAQFFGFRDAAQVVEIAVAGISAAFDAAVGVISDFVGWVGDAVNSVLDFLGLVDDASDDLDLSVDFPTTTIDPEPVRVSAEKAGEEAGEEAGEALTKSTAAAVKKTAPKIKTEIVSFFEDAEKAGREAFDIRELLRIDAIDDEAAKLQAVFENNIRLIGRGIEDELAALDKQIADARAKAADDKTLQVQIQGLEQAREALLDKQLALEEKAAAELEKQRRELFQRELESLRAHNQAVVSEQEKILQLIQDLADDSFDGASQSAEARLEAFDLNFQKQISDIIAGTPRLQKRLDDLSAKLVAEGKSPTEILAALESEKREIYNEEVAKTGSLINLTWQKYLRDREDLEEEARENRLEAVIKDAEAENQGLKLVKDFAVKLAESAAKRIEEIDRGAYERAVAGLDQEESDLRKSLQKRTISYEEATDQQISITERRNEAFEELNSKALNAFSIFNDALSSLADEQISAQDANLNSSLGKVETVLSAKKDELGTVLSDLGVEATTKLAAVGELMTDVFADAAGKVGAIAGKALADGQDAFKAASKGILDISLQVITALLPTAIFKIATESWALNPVLGAVIAGVGIAAVTTLFGVARAALERGFYVGGYTGDGDPRDPAGTVHRGEYVHDHHTTEKYFDFFERMHRGDGPLRALLESNDIALASDRARLEGIIRIEGPGYSVRDVRISERINSIEAGRLEQKIDGLQREISGLKSDLRRGIKEGVKQAALKTVSKSGTITATGRLVARGADLAASLDYQEERSLGIG